MGEEYEILLTTELHEFLDEVPDKSERIIRENLAYLSAPHPGTGRGDKKKIAGTDDSVYRFHIGRTWTAFYDIDDDEAVVRVLDIMRIDEAHKHYGQLD